MHKKRQQTTTKLTQTKQGSRKSYHFAEMTIYLNKLVPQLPTYFAGKQKQQTEEPTQMKFQKINKYPNSKIFIVRGTLLTFSGLFMSPLFNSTWIIWGKRKGNAQSHNLKLKTLQTGSRNMTSWFTKEKYYKIKWIYSNLSQNKHKGNNMRWIPAVGKERQSEHTGHLL